MSSEPTRRIVAAGGSIGGLCAGIALRGIGAEVDILERHPGPMETRGAGIVVQPERVNLLTSHAAPPLPTTGCHVRHYRSDLSRNVSSLGDHYPDAACTSNA